MARYEREQRGAPRRSIRVAGTVVTPDRSTLSCTVYDVSATGARIVLDAQTEVPDRFTLEIKGNETVRRLCFVVRRGEGDLGIRFLGI